MPTLSLQLPHTSLTARFLSITQGKRQQPENNDVLGTGAAAAAAAGVEAGGEDLRQHFVGTWDSPPPSSPASSVEDQEEEQNKDASSVGGEACSGSSIEGNRKGSEEAHGKEKGSDGKMGVVDLLSSSSDDDDDDARSSNNGKNLIAAMVSTERFFPFLNSDNFALVSLDMGPPLPPA
jgi:hypothetical protein